MAAGTKKLLSLIKIQTAAMAAAKNAGVKKTTKNVTERKKNRNGVSNAGTAHKKKTIRNVHKKKR